MSKIVTATVPDIGDFSGIPIIEILVEVGDEVTAEQSLVTLESDKATMEVPAPVDGVIKSVKVKLGENVSEGDQIAEIEVTESSEQTDAIDVKSAADTDASANQAAVDEAEKAAPTQTPQADETGGDYDYELVVLGSGPGGYTAAFRAADLGTKVALVERYSVLGGVCLNVGCIPSKALLHTADVIDQAASMAAHGVSFGAPKIELDKLRGFKDKVVGKLTGGLGAMAKQRKVDVVQGTGAFADAHTLRIEGEDGERNITFKYAIIAAGSQAVKLPGFPWDDPRMMDSTDALQLQDIPERLLVVGGGIIGLEMACVYEGLGSKVTVVELMDQLMPGCDPDLVKPLHRRVAKRYEAIYLKTKVTGVEAKKSGLIAHFEGGKAPESAEYDRILVAVGRSPNGANIDAEHAGVEVTERGFINVDQQMRTNVSHIFAIGDIVGQPMLAHKATHEAKVAAEVASGHKAGFDARVIPSVAYTDPEVAWVGLTEHQAKEQGVDYEVGKFPWAASGRAIGLDRTEGFSKLLFDKSTNRVLGAGIVGPHAGDLIAECALAIEMGCDAADIGLTIHPHPTLSETVAMAAEAFEGTITDLYMPKKK
ncbi:MAG: dihydrolipoyl dehydrogenase [Lysobacteraceae bacterium]|nr:MAG: dihydrolipoyl dehydrogenase [Xanthomonadaceae bacterium]